MLSSLGILSPEQGSENLQEQGLTHSLQKEGFSIISRSSVRKDPGHPSLLLIVRSFVAEAWAMECFIAWKRACGFTAVKEQIPSRKNPAL